MSDPEKNLRIGGMIAFGGLVGSLVSMGLTYTYRSVYEQNHQMRRGDPGGSLEAYQTWVLQIMRVEISWQLIMMLVSAAGVAYCWWRLRKL